MDNYECHVNVVLRDGAPDDHEGRAYAQRMAKKFGWKFSCIADEEEDPLDEGVMFFTRHDDDFDKSYGRMMSLFKILDGDPLLKPVRRKIEHVVYDVREGDPEMTIEKIRGRTVVKQGTKIIGEQG